MQPRIAHLTEKKLVGQSLSMSFLNNRTKELWQNFMPHRHEVKNAMGTDLYSVEIYPPNFFSNYNPAKNFEKWAAIEVSEFTDNAPGMKSIILQEGLYAVFLHIGPASKGPETYQYIFETWLPRSQEYSLDNKPHFAIMGDKYKPTQAESEEEIWIPVKLKGSN